MEHIKSDPKRIDTICELLKRLWALDDDARFFQLIYKLQGQYSHSNDQVGAIQLKDSRGFPQLTLYDLYNIEDDELIAYLEDYLQKEEKLVHS